MWEKFFPKHADMVLPTEKNMGYSGVHLMFFTQMNFTIHNAVVKL